MLVPMRGTLLGVTAMFLWGSVNASSRPPSTIQGWAFGAMVGVLLLAAGHQLFGIRAKSDFDSRTLGRLVISSLLSITLAGIAFLAAIFVERALGGATKATWGDSILRAAWHGLATLTIGMAVSPAAPQRQSVADD